MSEKPLAQAALGARLQRWFEPLGVLSPFVRLETFSPGATRLIRAMEQEAELFIHIVRLLAILLGSLLFALLSFGAGGAIPAGALVAGLALILGLWYVIWRHLRHQTPSLRFRFALAFLDAWLVARAVVFLHYPQLWQAVLAPMGLSDTLEFVRAVLTPAAVQTLTPPMLVCFAISGAFRLDPRLAAFTTLSALAIYVYLTSGLPLDTTQSIGGGLVIAFAGILGANTARVLRWVVLKAEEERVLEHYVPEGLTQELARVGDVERGGRVEDVTILMADIRGFTHLSEQLSPAEAVALLNAYFTAVVSPLAGERAVLDKYIGDGLLAFFEGPEHADRALRAGHAMLDAVEDFNETRPEEQPIRIGVAIHAGETLVGTIGAPSRRDYTVIGDVVNVTARLQEWNKGLSSKLIISDDALRRLQDSTLGSGLEGPVELDLHGREARARAWYLPAQ